MKRTSAQVYQLRKQFAAKCQVLGGLGAKIVTIEIDGKAYDAERIEDTATIWRVARDGEHWLVEVPRTKPICIQTSVSLPSDLRARVLDLADEYGSNASRIVTICIQQGLPLLSKPAVQRFKKK